MSNNPDDGRLATAETSGSLSLIAEARQHKAATLALVGCIVAGTVISAYFLPESISLPRRLAGGAVLGGLSWLLVMVGRLIDG